MTLRCNQAFVKEFHTQEGSDNTIKNGVNGNTCADAGEEQGQGTSDAEVNK